MPTIQPYQPQAPVAAGGSEQLLQRIAALLRDVGYAGGGSEDFLQKLLGLAGGFTEDGALGGAPGSGGGGSGGSGGGSGSGSGSGSGGAGGGACVAPQTYLLKVVEVTAAGIQEGDTLIGMDERGKLALSKIAAKQHLVQPCVRLHFEDGTQTTVSESHPFMGDATKQVKANGLKKGKKLVALTGEKKIAEVERLAGQHDVILIELEPGHRTYFSDGVLSHNKPKIVRPI